MVSGDPTLPASPLAALEPPEGMRSLALVGLSSDDATTGDPGAGQRPRDGVRALGPRLPRGPRRASLAGGQQRDPLREHQGDAPRQPAGAEFGAQRQGLLHAGAHGASRGLRRAAGDQTRLVAGAHRPDRGDRLPARHRQDRRVRPEPAQAGPALRRGVGADARAPGHQRRDHRAAARRAPRRRSASPPRVLRRQRVSRRPGRRGHLAHGAAALRRRFVRRDVVAAPLPPGAHVSRVPARARERQGHPVRSGDGRRVHRGARRPPRPEGHRPGRRVGGGGRDRSRDVRRHRRGRRGVEPSAIPPSRRCSTPALHEHPGALVDDDRGSHRRAPQLDRRDGQRRCAARRPHR